jgi:hypothetical protein
MDRRHTAILVVAALAIVAASLLLHVNLFVVRAKYALALVLILLIAAMLWPRSRN